MLIRIIRNYSLHQPKGILHILHMLHMKRSFAFLFAMSLCSAVAIAGLVTVQDATFDDADWTTVKVTDTSANVPGDSITGNGTFAYSGIQATTGGNPGSYRRVENELTSDVSFLIAAGHIFQSGTYNPSIQGAVTSVSFSFDAIGISGPVAEHEIRCPH